MNKTITLVTLLISAIPATAFADVPQPTLPGTPQAVMSKPEPKPQIDIGFKATSTIPVAKYMGIYIPLGGAALVSWIGAGISHAKANSAKEGTINIHYLIEAHRPLYNENQELCKQTRLLKMCARQEQLRADWKLYEKLAIGSYISAGVFTVLTGGIALYPWLKDLTKPEYRRIRKTEALQFTPMLSTKEQGIQLQYNF